MSDYASTGGLQQRAAILRQAAQVLQVERAATQIPRVVWAGIDESPDDYATRVAPYAYGSRPILAVVPYAYPLPPKVKRVELVVKAFHALHPSVTARYITLVGGRGGAKSWSVARVLVLLALSKPIRVLCCREVQRSLKDSSLRVLADQISMLGLDEYFEVQNASISSQSGAVFLFEGLLANVARIKSMEGIDIAWCEQAEALSENSWSTLLPTIRKAGSRIIVTYNPDLEDDPTHIRFSVNPPPNQITSTLSYLENPWTSPELRAEAEYLRTVDPDAYEWIWGGQCRKHSAAQVFSGKYSIESFEPAPDWGDPLFGCDWGFSVDPTVLIKLWIRGNELFIEHEAYQVGCELDRLPQLFDTVPGARKGAIRADNSRPETISYMVRAGFPGLQAADKWAGSVEDGISYLKQFQRIVVHPRCVHVIEELKLFSYKTHALTSDVLPELKPGHDHCIDAIRYAVQPLVRGGGSFTALMAHYKSMNSGTAKPATKWPSSTTTQDLSGVRP